MSAPNVFGRVGCPTETDYETAVREIILALAKEHSQKDIAQRLGITPETVHNAQEMKTGLKGWVIARIAYEFGPAAIAPFMALGDAIAVPKTTNAANDLRIIAGMNEASSEWLQRLIDGIRCGKDTKDLASIFRPLIAQMQAIVNEAEAA